MYSMGHSYILLQILPKYNWNKESFLKIALGNLIPDFISTRELDKDEYPDAKVWYLNIHNQIQRLNAFGHYNLEHPLERGLIIHSMADNISRVGTPYRLKNQKKNGTMYKLETALNNKNYKIRLKPNFKKGLINLFVDMFVLENYRLETMQLYGNICKYVNANLDRVSSELNQITEVLRFNEL